MLEICSEGVAVLGAGIREGSSLFRDGEKYVVADHAEGNTFAEFEYLPADVLEEGIGRPPAHEHNHVDRCVVHEHSQCGY